MTDPKTEWPFSSDENPGEPIPSAHHTSANKHRQKENVFRKYFLDPFVSSNRPPWFDARGIAVGLFVGFGVPIGTQLIFLGVLRSLFRFNMLMAFAFTWVNNPISLIPMYYGYYYLGSLLLGKPPVMTASAFQEIMTPIIHADYFWQAAESFLYLGWDFVVRWTVMALIIGVVTGAAGYAIGYYIQTEHCRRKAARMGITYEKLLNEMERSVRQK